MKSKFILLVLLVLVLMASKGMKQVPFEVINKSGQDITVELWRYEDDYPAKFYAFRLDAGTRARPRSGVWEVWKGDYALIVYGEDMSECLLPIDDLDLKPGLDITIKGKYRLVVPPCQEVFKNPGEPSQQKYDWSGSYIEDPATGAALTGWYKNWWTYLK